MWKEPRAVVAGIEEFAVALYSYRLRTEYIEANSLRRELTLTEGVVGEMLEADLVVDMTRRLTARMEVGEVVT